MYFRLNLYTPVIQLATIAVDRTKPCLVVALSNRHESIDKQVVRLYRQEARSGDSRYIATFANDQIIDNTIEPNGSYLYKAIAENPYRQLSCDSNTLMVLVRDLLGTSLAIHHTPLKAERDTPSQSRQTQVVAISQKGTPERIVIETLMSDGSVGSRRESNGGFVTIDVPANSNGVRVRSRTTNQQQFIPKAVADEGAERFDRRIDHVATIEEDRISVDVHTDSGNMVKVIKKIGRDTVELPSVPVGKDGTAHIVDNDVAAGRDVTYEIRSLDDKGRVEAVTHTSPIVIEEKPTETREASSESRGANSGAIDNRPLVDINVDTSVKDGVHSIDIALGAVGADTRQLAKIEVFEGGNLTQTLASADLNTGTKIRTSRTTGSHMATNVEVKVTDNNGYEQRFTTNVTSQEKPQEKKSNTSRTTTQEKKSGAPVPRQSSTSNKETMDAIKKAQANLLAKKGQTSTTKPRVGK